MIATFRIFKRYNKTTFYTIRIEGRERNELDDFIIRMNANYWYKEDLKYFVNKMKIMGEAWGAKEVFFRPERAFHAMPPLSEQLGTYTQKDQGLRLYCLRLGPSIVIMLNGDMKTEQKAQDCPKCGPHFDIADRFTRAFDKAKLDGYIELDHENGEILIDEDFIFEF